MASWFRRVPTFNLGRHFRSFGLLVAGLVLVSGTGGFVIYGLLWFYLRTPGTRPAEPVLGPINEAVAGSLTADATLAFLAIAGVAYAWEVKVNGVWPTDDRLLIEKLDDKRKELAKKRDAWSHPEVDDEDDGIYGDLEEKLTSDDDEPSAITARDGEFVLTKHAANMDESPPRVRGIVENRSGENVDHVQVDVDFYDGTGDKIGEGFDLKSGFAAESRWQFEANFMGPEAKQPQGYRINSLSVE